VLKIVDAQGHSLLLTGDIEAAQEAWLVEQAAVTSAPDPSGLSSVQTQLQVDGLVAPHHGSASSSSAAFLDAVKPRLVWIQSGYRNRYGHPHRQVLDRYASRGIQVLNTVDCGAWQGLGAAISQAVDALAACQRVQRLRYWQRPSPLGRPPGLFGDL
jgi:competence protein ComEC